MVLFIMFIYQARDMRDTEEHNEVNITKSEDEESVRPEKGHSDGTIHYVFMYCTIFLLALFVALQFEPLIGYRYPVLLLVAAVILLFIGTSLQELKQKRTYQSKKHSLFITLLIIMMEL